MRNTTTLPVKQKELAKKLLEVEDKRDRLIFTLSLFSGLRYNEIASIRWFDLLSHSGNLEIQTSKQKKVRYIPIGDFLQSVIDDCYELQDEDVYIMRPRRGTSKNKAMSIVGYNKLIKKYFKNLKIKTKNASSHCLRKTFSWRYFQDNGGDFAALLLLQKNLGHSSPDITLRYLGVEWDNVMSGFGNVSYE